MEELSFVNAEDFQRDLTPRQSPVPASSAQYHGGSIVGESPANRSSSSSHHKPPDSPGGSVDSTSGISRGSETARSVKSSRSHRSKSERYSVQ